MMLYRHNFPVKLHNVSMDQRTEMKLWCKDNVGDPIKTWSYTYDLSGDATFHFNTIENAILFKLAWL